MFTGPPVSGAKILITKSHEDKQRDFSFVVEKKKFVENGRAIFTSPVMLYNL
jgi:hypothetical protein